MVTTYQAGRLVILRPEPDSGSINTHFLGFSKPMGLAVRPNRIAVGTAQGLFELHNVPAVARKLEPADRYDACFLPRWGHVTGDIAIIELPGFTRGLDFAGNLAFVGLSQVRESAVFSGIQITERLKPEERTCGVWVSPI